MKRGFRTLYRSPNPKSLEDSLLHKILEFKKNSPLSPLFVLVPNNYIAAHLKHEMAAQTAHINIYFETIESFAKQVISNKISFVQKRCLPAEAEIQKVKSISEKILANTDFTSVSGKRGFIKNLVSFFHHMISEKSDSIPAVNEKTKAFESIYQEYLKLKNTYYTGLWNVELASKETLSIDAAVFIYGFPSFSKLEQSFFTNISKFTTLDLWMEIFSSEQFQMSTLLWLDNVFTKSEDLSTQESTTKIIVQPCYHLDDEAHWISHTILQQQKSDPVSFRRIGIFLNHFSSQETFIRKALTSSHLPFVSIQDVRFLDTRVGLAFQALVSMMNTNWNRAQWFDFLELFPFESNIYSENGLPGDWSKISVEAGISSRRSFFINRLEAYASRKKNEKTDSFVEFQKDLLQEFSGFEKQIHDHQYVLLIQSLESFFHRYSNPSFVSQPFLLFFDDLRYILSNVDEQIPWDDVRAMLLEKFETSFYNEKIFESDGIFIAPISMMKSLFFDSVFIPQLNEGKFPKLVDKTFDLHSEEIRDISTSSKIKFENVQNGMDVQSSWFESAKHHATKNLYLSFSKYSLPEEDDLKPSVLLEHFTFEKIYEPDRISQDIVKTTFTTQIRRWIESYDSRTWSSFNAYLNPSYVVKDIYSATELSTYAVCPRRYYLRHILGLSLEDYLEDEHQMTAKDKGTIVHEILFRFFLSLKTNGFLPIKKTNRELIHQQLEKIATDVFSNRQILLSYGITNLWDMERERIFSDITEYVDREILDSSYWIPTSFEYRFGMPKFTNQEDDPDSFEKPIELQLFQKKLNFKGKVDRLDFSPDHSQMRITDYKTGNLMERKSWGYDKGTNLQLPLYLLLSDGFFPGKRVDEVVGKLISLQSMTKFDERNVSKTQIMSMKDELFQHLELLDYGIKSGFFFPNPGNGAENCRYCDYKNICGENIDQVVQEIDVTPFMESYFESKKSLP